MKLACPPRSLAKPAGQYLKFELSALRVRPCCTVQPETKFTVERVRGATPECQDGHIREDISARLANIGKPHGTPEARIVAKLANFGRIWRKIFPAVPRNAAVRIK